MGRATSAVTFAFVAGLALAAPAVADPIDDASAALDEGDPCRAEDILEEARELGYVDEELEERADQACEAAREAERERQREQARERSEALEQDSSDDTNDSDLPEPLSTSQVSRTIRQYGRQLAECRGQSDLPPGEVLNVDVRVTIQSSGRVSVAESDSSDGAAACIADVVGAMRFEEFSGPDMNFTYPFRLR